MPRALLSVTDKTGLEQFARGLVDLGFELVSTGGTAKALRESGLNVKDVSEITNFPEMLDGRVKTLHPMVHGGLLGDTSNPEHVEQMHRAGIEAIELLCVNLYAFEQTVTSSHTLDEAIESIDIGGPAMIRAAAKNSSNVTVVTEPDDYEQILTALRDGSIKNLRLSLMAKAFRHTAYYDALIARYFTEASGSVGLEEKLTRGYRKQADLRYGENPHQGAALYIDPIASPGLANGVQLWGKELSYNNLLDADAAWELVADLPKDSCAIIKHGNPCGAALGETLGDSYRLARDADPVSAFGGIAAFNGKITKQAAEAMTEKGNFLEVVVGTSFDEDAIELFMNRSSWGQNVRLISAPLPPDRPELIPRTIRGGVLVQHSDEEPSTSEWVVVTKKKPTEDQITALRFQWTIARHVKSNAIVVGTSNKLLGVGAGQMNRVQSVRLALEQAGSEARGAALASDAFFPFPDSIVTAAGAGITAIVQPGGSKKDQDVIDTADRLDLVMLFTGIRHFRH